MISLEMLDEVRLRISERLTTTADMTNIKDCNLNKALLEFWAGLIKVLYCLN